MAGSNDDRVLVLSKRAFVSTLVAIALNPIGVAIGYGLGKWLQAPRLSAPTVVVEAEIEPVKLTPDLARGILEDLDPSSPYNLLAPEERSNIRQGRLDSRRLRDVLVKAEDFKASIASFQQDLDANVEALLQWHPPQELILRPLFIPSVSEAHQSIALRDKRELLSIYRSEQKDVQKRIERLLRLIDFVREAQSDHVNKRTGETVIRVGVLNSGDSEGLVYPTAVLRCSVGEVNLTAKVSAEPVPPFILGLMSPGLSGGDGAPRGGYLVVPPHSFREAVFVMDHSTRGDAADRWKNLVRAGKGDDVDVELQTSRGILAVRGKLPL